METKLDELAAGTSMSDVSEDAIDPNSVTPFEMAYKYYNRLWVEAQAELAYLLQKEPPVDEPPEVVPDRLVLVRRTSKQYLKYIKVANKIVKCYEHIAQPQKRILLRKMADACIGRVLELKLELVLLENSEFQFLDQMLLTLRMLPSDMDLKIPEYFKEIAEEEEQHKKLVERNLSILSEKMIDEKYIVTEKVKFVKTAMVFVRLLQAHERTRQARETFHEYQKKLIVKELNKRREARKEMQISKSRQNAAITIQRAWRLYILRRSLKKEYVAEMNFLGMLPRYKNNVTNEIEAHRIEIIKRNEKDYSKAKSAIKAEIVTCRVPKIMESLEDNIRSYFHSYFEIFGAFPEFPTEEDGGSTKMFETSVDIDTEEKETTEADSMSESQKETKSEKSSKDTKSKDGKSKDEKAEAPEGYSLKPSKFVPDLINFQEEYDSVWKGKEPVNFDRFDYDMLKQNVMQEIDLEVRQVVDEKMRMELQRLTEAFQKDSKKKGKSKKGKGKKKGKDKGKKGKKGKKEKDLTPHRSTESLIEELVTQGIIKSYPKYKLENFTGDYHYSGSLQHLAGDPQNDPMPCLCDIRRVVNEYCILPMGSREIHSKGAYIKSILFAGPKGVGKKSLIYAICNEINATMMDLSADNIDGKYPGKEGKEMLLHLVLKVGRLVEPTVIFVNNAENYFYKKKPATCTIAEPGRLKKDIPKFLKSIRDDDRILICGTTVTPFDVDLKGLGGSYQKVICFSKPDYNCRRSLWREMIIKHGGILTRKLDMSVLCNVSDGFTASAIENTVRETLTERRLAYQNKIPLNASDLLPGLAKHVPVFEEEIAAYKQWFEKMPLRKKRISLLELESEDAEQEVDESEEED